ncbi:MAG: DUF2721 domain-containing protein [Epulopiscium sp.]|nr:DUF2721 domain-containing protein [Candidatus Epulonipiscium sp.]
MGLPMTTPALLFPAISLLMLAYTNRFVVLAQLVRELYIQNRQEPDVILEEQISNLRTRLDIIRNMQILGALSFFFCVMSMLLLYLGSNLVGSIIFGISLLMLLASLGLLVVELQMSINALNIQLQDCKKSSILKRKNKIK